MPLRLQKVHDNAIPAAALMGALANPRRLQVLCRISEGEIAVGRLADTLGISQSALSQHLAKLRRLDLVETRREAQTIYYSLRPGPITDLLAAIDAIYEGNSRGGS